LDKILIQPDLCDGCKDCEQACGKLYGTPRISVREIEGSFYPIICQQCEDAPCKMICPTEAMGLEVLEAKCIGCGLCMMVCPFGSINIENRKAHKCNQCPDKDTPACIAACSKRAIAKVDTERMKLEKQKQHIEKLVGLGKKKKKSTDMISVLTANARTKKVLHKEV
jgi:anaerobic carbon-monoxide dehydrogenase iron sulfur subunit